LGSDPSAGAPVGRDQEGPFARIHHQALLGLLNGGTIVEMHRDHAIIETLGGAHQTYPRRPVGRADDMGTWRADANSRPPRFQRRLD
jgi:hypothetical protein